MQSGSERRGAPRVEVRASATLVLEGGAACAQVLEDLSLTGARLVGRAPSKAPLRLLMRCAGRLLELPAQVVRLSPRADGRVEVGLAFQLEPREHAQLKALLEAYLAHSPPDAEVLVFDTDPATRGPLARRLRLLGRRVIEARTPLEAAFALQREELARGVAFLGHRLHETAVEEFVHFALGEYPELLLVTARPIPGALSSRVRSLSGPASCLRRLRALLSELERSLPHAPA